MAVGTRKITAPPVAASSFLSRQLRQVLLVGTVTLFASLVIMVYLMPMAYAVSTSARDKVVQPDAPLWPAQPTTFSYQGQVYDIYTVPLPDGSTRDLALVKKGRAASTFVDPAQPEEQIEWKGAWRTLNRQWSFQPQWSNYSTAFTMIHFARLFLNTFTIAIIGMIGTVISSTLVAYGFSRFHLPGKSILFMILISTIILPAQVTQIPTYTIFNRIGWTGTWLPLLIPHFFANAYNVFLLRQFFMGIPREMDEAAMIDGASPFRTLISIIIPQAWPAIVAVSLFHFFFAWNDFFSPLIYLAGKENLYPISIGIMQFNALYASQPHLVQATTVMAMALPLLIFMFAQRFFMQGVVVTGVDK